MNNSLRLATGSLMIAMLIGAPSLHAGKPPKTPEVEPWLAGPIVNPGSDLLSTESAAGGDGSSIYYGDDVGFVQHDVLLSNKQRSYVTVICIQDGNVVYQASQWGADMLVYSLADLPGQGLEWNAGPADCTATLIINEQKGNKVTITQVDQASFVVE